MKVSVDIKGLETLLHEAEKEISDGMMAAAKRGVDYAKERGNYKNHTYNLRNAAGAAVLLDGKVVDIYIPADSNHAKAKAKTMDLINSGGNPENGIVIANGMEYASYVEAKKYDVISGGALVAYSEAVKTFEK